jgi:hypothetical protein
MRIRRYAVPVIVSLAAVVLAGGVVAAGFDWSTRSEELPDALREAQPVQVADIPSADGLAARGVFAQLTATGLLCISDAPLDDPQTGGGGCNPADDPLGGEPLSASLSYEGGPAIRTVRDARLIGLASTDVASVRVLMSDGSSRTVKLRRWTDAPRPLQAYGFRLRKSDLKKGIGPVAVIAFGANGTEVGRQTTGIG